MADVVHELRRNTRLKTTVVFTGQHTKLMEEAAAALEIRPDLQLDPLPSGRGLTDLLANVVQGLGQLAATANPACVVVQGDTVSSLGGAIMSELLAIPLVHVEAGVRSKLRDDPFPEETIRRMISPITELHICFSKGTRQNLIDEGVPSSAIAVAPHPIKDRVAEHLARNAAEPTGGILITLHRRERRRERAAEIVELARRVRDAAHGTRIQFLWHPGLSSDPPGLADALVDVGVQIVEPMPPDLFLARLASVSVVITDSAGVAEEAQMLGRPLVVFRRSGELRIDEPPSVPIHTTESANEAMEFILDNIRSPRGGPANVEVDGLSAGAIIGDLIESFLHEQVAA
ncbi:MAG: UDP-N-acetylglucosamine 2-epimerase [Solirubrobacterales bacterium]